MFKEQFIILGEHKIPSKTVDKFIPPKTVDKFIEKPNFLALLIDLISKLLIT